MTTFGDAFFAASVLARPLRTQVDVPFCLQHEARYSFYWQYAQDCLKDSFRRGEYPLLPAMVFFQPGLLNDSNGEEISLGIKTSRQWGQVAQQLAVYTDLGIDATMQCLIEQAKQDGIGVDFRHLPVGRY